MNNFLTYSGGKSTLALEILSMIGSYGNHTYIEPFIGGGAILCQKPRAKINIINDINYNIANFYRILQTKPNELIEELNKLTYDEGLFYYYRDMLKGVGGTELERAVAVFYTQFSFGGSGVAFAYSPVADFNKKFQVKISQLRFLSDLIKDTTIFNRSAERIIGNKTFDTEEVFFYLDPPYVDTEQVAYKNENIYTIKDYRNLVKLLRGLKNAKFILSHVEVDDKEVNDELSNFKHRKVDVFVSGVRNDKGGEKPKRTEYLYYNYNVDGSLTFDYE